jgi:hypothetical protein
MEHNWNNTLLCDYLNRDYWTSKDAMRIIAGFNPDSNSFNEESLISILSFDEDVLKKSLYNSLALIRRLKNLWVNSEYSYNEDVDLPFSETPSWFVNYFYSKDIEPEWMDWALQKQKISLEFINNGANLVFDEDKYPEELHIACDAYNEAIKDNSPISPKQKIKKILQKKYKHLSNEAIDRISTVANWNKEGGAPKKQD